MLLSVVYFLPCLVCLLWFISFLFKVKNQRQKLFMWIMFLGVLYYAAYASYIFPDADYETMVRIDVLGEPVGLALGAAQVLYMNMRRTGKPLNALHFFLFIPALLVGVVVNLFYYILGFDATVRLAQSYDAAGGHATGEFNTGLYKLYLFFDVDVFSVVGGLLLLALLVQCVLVSRKYGYKFGDAFRFFFMGKPTHPARSMSLLYICSVILLAPVIILGRTYVMNHMMLGSTLCLLIALCQNFLGHVEFHSPEEGEVSLYSLSHLNQQAQKNKQFEEKPSALEENPAPVEQKPAPVEESIPDEEKEPLPEEHEHHGVDMAGASKLEALAEKFRILMEEEKLYRQDDLNMAALAEKMGVGRTTLSTMINQYYGIPFREVLNKYRVEAVKCYLLENPTTTQETLAFECGFKDASSLNKKFKEVEGDTPLIWLTKQAR